MIEKNTVLDDIEKIMDQKEDERLPAKLDSLKAYLALLLKFPLLSLEGEREITRLVYEDFYYLVQDTVKKVENLKAGSYIFMGTGQHVPRYP